MCIGARVSCAKRRAVVLSRTFLFEKVQIMSALSARALSWLNSGQLYSGNHSATFRWHHQQVLRHAFSLVSMVCQLMVGAGLQADARTGQCWVPSVWPEQGCSETNRWLCAHKSTGWPWIWTIWIVWRSICIFGLCSVLVWAGPCVLYSWNSNCAECVCVSNTVFCSTNSAIADCALLRCS